MVHQVAGVIHQVSMYVDHPSCHISSPKSRRGHSDPLSLLGGVCRKGTRTVCQGMSDKVEREQTTTVCCTESKKEWELLLGVKNWLMVGYLTSQLSDKIFLCPLAWPGLLCRSFSFWWPGGIDNRRFCQLQASKSCPFLQQIQYDTYIQIFIFSLITGHISR